MAVIFVPAMLREFADGNDRVEVAGATVRDLLDELRRHYPALAARLTYEGRLSDGLAVAVDGVVRSQGLRALVGPQSEVHFLPALGGGCDGNSQVGSHTITGIERREMSMRYCARFGVHD